MPSGSKAPVNILGQRFGLLVVLERAVNSVHAKTQWLCKCDCGKETIVVGNNLKSGTTKSCGCLRHKAYRKTHGMSGTPAYTSWRGMLDRTRNPKNSAHKWYQDVSVCDHWLDFSNFFEDMGPRPDGMSIDRIDPYGDYCPENCRWADASTQAYNRKPKS